MTKQHATAVLGALALTVLATAGCKQPVRSTAAPAAAPASATSTSGAVPAPISGTAAGGTAAGGGASDLRTARRQVREACRDDLQACKTAGGDTRPMRCLRARMDQLKPECKQALQTMLAERREGHGGRRGR